MKKLLTVLMSAVLVSSLAACGNTSQTKGSSTDAAKSDGTKEAEGTPGNDAATDPWANVDTSKHVKIVYMTTGDRPSGTEAKYEDMMKELNKILTEKINAELEIYFIPWTDYLTNYNLTLAQMDGSVDLVGTASDWLDAWPNAKNGAFLELSEDMLKTYAPKTFKSVSSDHWDMCKYADEIYMMPEDNYAQWTNHGFIYRLDWAKEAGLDKVASWEDLTAYFRYVKKTYPDMIPWDCGNGSQFNMSSGWTASHTNFVMIEGISACGLWGGTRDDLYTIVTPAYTDTDMLVNYAKMMKEWDDIGVWRTDVLNVTTSANREEYRVGQSAAEQHHTQTWTDLVSHTSANKIYQDDPKAESGFFYFGEETGNVTAISITHGAMAVSAASANPERALMAYDLMRNDPDVYHLLCYGIKGVSWDENEEGLRIEPEGYNNDTDNINTTTDFWWGRNDDIEIRDASRDWDKIDALYDEYNKLKIDYPYGQFVPEVDDIQSKITNITETYSNYMQQITYGKYPGSAEDFVAEMQKSLKQAGIEEVTAELQKQFDLLYK